MDRRLQPRRDLVKYADLVVLHENIQEAAQAARADAVIAGTREAWEIAENLNRALYDLAGAVGWAALNES